MNKILIILSSILLFSCAENINEAVDEFKFNSDGDAALILAVETNFELSASIEYMFRLYKEEAMDILSDMFGVEKNDMQGMSMSEIVEVYGETWQINAMIEAVGDRYKEIKVLTDDSCRGGDLMNAISEFAEKGYYIDMVFSLHASETKYIYFIDRGYYVGEFTNFLTYYNFYIRALYQTCCYGSYFFDDWTNAGMYALNGSVKTNGINIFSPVYFLEEWVANGLNFNDAVEKAYEREIEKLMTYNNVLPIESFFLSPANLENSKMKTDGIYDRLKWNEFPYEKSNKPGV